MEKNIMGYTQQLFLSLSGTIHYLHTHNNVRYILIAIILLIATALALGINNRNQETSAIDFAAIAGDNVETTQLDLAKAYIEMGQKLQAKQILKQTYKNGSRAQKDAARKLLKAL